MTIQFTGRSAINPETFGISFEALVDGEKVICNISTEALQDIDPLNASSEPIEQFEANQYRFQEIAKALILKGKVQKGRLFIASSDVV
jgi:hypothetical protein